MSTAFSVEVVSLMRRLRQARMPLRAVAAALGVSLSSVEKYGRTPVPKRRAVVAGLKSEMQRLRSCGLSGRAVAERLGVSASTVWTHTPSMDLRGVHPNAVVMMVALDKQGLSRTAIAQRLGLHGNTVVKYLLREGRPRKRK